MPKPTHLRPRCGRSWLDPVSALCRDRRARELRGDGLRDEPERLHRRRPRPRAGRRLHRDQPPHRRHVCARARQGAHRPHRAAHVPGLGARDHVRVDGDAGLGRVDRLDVGLALPARSDGTHVAASAELVTHATPVERGRLVGFTDLTAGSSPRLSRCSAAPCTRSGAVAIAVGSTVAVVVPALALLVGRRPSAAALEPTG